MEEYTHQLPTLFQKMLLVWKDTSASNNWILEKIMEVFCKHIAPDKELMKAVEFGSILNMVQEKDTLIHYPDFVMNSMSLMAADVLLSCPGDSCCEHTAFKIIRSPLQYWLVTKGHRVDVTFQIYLKFVRNRSMLHLLEEVEFDVSHALTQALASPHNYTRRSACSYFVELVKLAFDGDETPSDTDDFKKTKSKLRRTISQYIAQFNEELRRHAATKTKKTDGDTGYSEDMMSAVVSYCKLLSECAAASDSWCQEYAATDLLDVVLELLQAVASDTTVDHADLYRCCIQFMIKLISNDNHKKKEKLKKLLEFLMVLCQIPAHNIVCDVIYVAGALLSECDFEGHAQELLFELSLLPMLVIFAVEPKQVPSICPSLMSTMQTYLMSEQTTKPSSLLRDAVKNLSVVVKQNIDTGCYTNVLDYMTLNQIDPPREVGQPLLYEGRIRNNKILNYLVLELAEIKPLLGDLDVCSSRALLDCIQIYSKACLNFPGISHSHLSVFLECYVAALTQVMQRPDGVYLPTHLQQNYVTYDKQILHDVLQSLMLKMVDLDASIRELAVETTGDLYLTDKLGSCFAEEMSEILASLWTCVEDKAEGVATKVIKFLWRAADSSKLEPLFVLMHATKETVTSRVAKFLLASPWDNIKPVAFNLLTKLCPGETLVRYAEVCFCQDNSLLALTVLDYMKSLFTFSHENITLEEKVDRVIALLSQGWGDLMLHKANAVDTCSFREAASIMKHLHDFMELPEVSSVVEKRVLEFSQQSRSACAGNSGNAQDATKYFVSVCDGILKENGVVQSKNPSIGDSEECEVTDEGHKTLKRSSAALGVENPENQIAKKCKADYKAEEITQRQSKTNSMSSVASFLSMLLSEEAISEELLSESKRDFTVESETNSSEPPQLATNGDEELFIDSTNELPALTLSSKPFSSQRHIQACLSLSNIPLESAESAIAENLLFWYMYQEMLRKIDPKSLTEEASRSTDEYERNCAMLLHDFEQVLDRSFCNSQEQLESELASHFLNCFAGFLGQVAQVKGNVELQGKFLQDLVSYQSFLSHISRDTTDIVKFILQHRRCVLKPQIPPSEKQFILDYFCEKLHNLKNDGFSHVALIEYHSAEKGLSSVLDLYRDKKFPNGNTSEVEQTSHASFSTVEKPTDRNKMLTKDTTSQSDTGFQTNNVISVLKDLLGGVDLSAAKNILSCLEPNKIQQLYENLNEQTESRDEIQELVKTLLASSRHEKLHDIIQILRKLITQLMLVILESEEGSRIERYSNVGVCITQLENWFCSVNDEYDSEGDNDPTALDCF